MKVKQLYTPVGFLYVAGYFEEDLILDEKLTPRISNYIIIINILLSFHPQTHKFRSYLIKKYDIKSIKSPFISENTIRKKVVSGKAIGHLKLSIRKDIKTLLGSEKAFKFLLEVKSFCDSFELKAEYWDLSFTSSILYNEFQLIPYQPILYIARDADSVLINKIFSTKDACISIQADVSRKELDDYLDLNWDLIKKDLESYAKVPLKGANLDDFIIGAWTVLFRKYKKLEWDEIENRIEEFTNQNFIKILMAEPDIKIRNYYVDTINKMKTLERIQLQILLNKAETYFKNIKNF